MRKALLFLLRGYKWAISPLLPPACRYVPTCSEYAMEALERYGVLRGGVMAVWRVLRCHPLARGGFDPVVSEARNYEAGSTRKKPEQFREGSEASYFAARNCCRRHPGRSESNSLA
jgi:putative membrane protein insertion efficiency factor